MGGLSDHACFSFEDYEIAADRHTTRALASRREARGVTLEVAVSEAAGRRAHAAGHYSHLVEIKDTKSVLEPIHHD